MFYQINVRYWSYDVFDDKISEILFFGKENALHYAKMFRDGYNVKSVMIIDALTGEIVYDSEE